MRLAYSSNAYTKFALSEAIDSIAALGFSGVEILCDRPHWFLGEVSEDDIEEVCEKVAKLGLTVSNLNANTTAGYSGDTFADNPFEPAMDNEDAGLRQWRVNYSIAAIHVAKKLGARCISVTSGRERPGGDRGKINRRFADALKRVCEVAEREGVCVGLEYEPGLQVSNAEQAMEIIGKVDSALLGVNFDIGHSFLMKEAPLETARMLRGRIWNVHIEDIRGEEHFHLPPGDGEIPLASYVDALSENGYDGFLTVELYTYPDCPAEVGRKSLHYLTHVLGIEHA